MANAEDPLGSGLRASHGKLSDDAIRAIEEREQQHIDGGAG